MNELEVKNLSYALSAPAFDGPAARILSSCKNMLVYVGGGEVQTMKMPDNEAKIALRSRQDYLFREMKRHDNKAKAALIGDLLECYGERRDENVRATIIKYVQEVQGIPTWAVSLACQAIKIGQAPEVSPAHRPTTIQFVLVCRRYMAPTLQEIHEINDVLRAKPYIKPLTQEERETVGARLQTFAEEFRGMGALAKEAAHVDALRQRQGDKRARRDREAILRSYGKRKPVYAGDFLVSPSLIAAIKAA